MNIFFDTCILSRICWSESEKQCEVRWGYFLEIMHKIYPGFAEEDIYWVHTTSLMLECIGLGKIKFKNNSHVFNNYKPLSSLISCYEFKKYQGQSEIFVKDIERAIKLWIEEQLTADNIYNKTQEHFKNYPNHELSVVFSNEIIKWAENLKANSVDYEIFYEDVLWECISKYRFMNPDDIHSKKLTEKQQEENQKFWGEILAILCKKYLDLYNTNASFQNSLLGLFSEIHRIGNSQKYKNILRQWDDMVDADSIHYSLVGKRISLEQNEPVVVITIDKKNDVERRLECLFKNIQDIKQYGVEIKICPGTIILLEENTLNFKEIIKVEDLIEGF